MNQFRAVLFDWRGTLVTTLSPEGWVAAALKQLGRDHDDEIVGEIWAAIASAAGHPDRLDAPGVDSNAAFHRATYYGVFADAGLDAEISDALYAVESDPAYNPFALDAVATLRAAAQRGCRIGIISDIHFDLRPAFAAEGIADVIDAFVLSYELGLQKPNPAMFGVALEKLGTSAQETLMVGDRRLPDGGAVDMGMTTLLIPPLADVKERRLHLVEGLLTAAPCP
jgi:FMN phosphatase YigB (HAD superfamily)